MAYREKKRRRVKNGRIALKEIPAFVARGMQRVHTWRLTRMDEFHRILAYHGQIWATKDDRLLVRFKTKSIMWRTYNSLLNYEICGMTVADLLRQEFDPNSAEVAGLKGNVIAVRDNGSEIVISGGTVSTLNCRDVSYGPGIRETCTEAVFWLAWVPKCVRERWDEWVEHEEFD